VAPITHRSHPASRIVRRAAAKIDGVSKISLAQKIGIVGRVAAQQIGRRLERSRAASAILRGAQATARSFGRVLHQLWLEVTGFTFLVLAAIGAAAGLREYAKYQAGQASGPGRVILAVVFTALFVWFGLSSFWRVRKKS